MIKINISLSRHLFLRIDCLFKRFNVFLKSLGTLTFDDVSVWLRLIDWLIAWIVFYAVSVIFPAILRRQYDWEIIQKI